LRPFTLNKTGAPLLELLERTRHQRIDLGALEQGLEPDRFQEPPYGRADTGEDLSYRPVFDVALGGDGEEFLGEPVALVLIPALAHLCCDGTRPLVPDIDEAVDLPSDSTPVVHQFVHGRMVDQFMRERQNHIVAAVHPGREDVRLAVQK